MQLASGSRLSSTTQMIQVRENDLMRLIFEGKIPPRIWLQLSEENKTRIKEMNGERS